MNSKASALVVATMDTKGQEVLFIAECLENEGGSVCLMANPPIRDGRI